MDRSAFVPITHAYSSILRLATLIRQQSSPGCRAAESEVSRTGPTSVIGVFSLSMARFNSSSFCPASPSLPSAVRRW